MYDKENLQSENMQYLKVEKIVYVNTLSSISISKFFVEFKIDLLLQFFDFGNF